MSSFWGNWSPLLVQCSERFSEELGIFLLDWINEPTRLFCGHLVWTTWPTCQHSVLGSLLILILGTGWNLEIFFYSLSWLLWSSYILEVFRAAFCAWKPKDFDPWDEAWFFLFWFIIIIMAWNWVMIILSGHFVNILTPYSPFLFNKTPSVWK